MKSRQTQDIEYTIQHNSWHYVEDKFKIRVFNELRNFSYRLDDLEKKWPLRERKLGDMFVWPGRMISGNKTGPKDHVCVWNANICFEDGTKIWYGDLDLTADAKDLQWYADDLGKSIFVMKEMDARFLREGERVDISRAVATFIPEE